MAEQLSFRVTDSQSVILLPTPPTNLVGRTSEIAALRQLLRQPHARWITLTGPGGTGKTRLALEVASQVADEYAHGVYFIALDALRDPPFVLPTLARALGVQESATEPLLSALQAALADKQILLVLDNMEQVATAAEEIAALMDTALRLRVLATSRELVRVYGEHNFPVPTLRVPANAEVASAETLAQNEAVQLFYERARAVRPDLTLTRENARVIAFICARLDGLPLALELVAAHARTLSLAQLLARVNAHWHLWIQGAPNPPPHQVSLRAAMDWSYNLLSHAEQKAFVRLGVFAGSWSLEAALAITGADTDMISSLADKSLVRIERIGDAPRFSLLETIREYALEHLQNASDSAAFYASHVHYFVQIAERAETELTGQAQPEWLERLQLDHDNFRAAIRWSLENAAVNDAFQLVTGLWRFWYVRGYFTEGRAWLEATLKYAPQAAPLLRAKAFNSAGVLARSQGNFPQARSWLEASRAEYQTLNDSRGLANVLNSLGLLALDQIDYAAAREHFVASLALERTLGSPRRIAISLNNLGNVAGYERDFVQAESFFRESLAIRRELNDTAGIANALLNLGEVALLQKEFARALDLYRASIGLRRELGDRRGIALCLEGIAASIASNNARRATELYSVAAELRRALNAPHAPVERSDYQNNLAALRGQLGEMTYESLWKQARVWNIDQAVDLALQVEQQARQIDQFVIPFQEQSMFAIRIHNVGGPDVLQYEEIETPTPNAGQVRVKLSATGINYIDTYHRTGLYKLPLPAILGREGAGVIDAVGDGVTSVQMGDRVAFVLDAPAYAEYAILPAARVVRVPDAVSLEDAAAVLLQGLTAQYLCFSTYPLKRGEWCLIHAAAGGAGQLTVQVAKIAGAYVIGTCSTEEKARVAREAGCDEVILYAKTDFVPEVKRITNNKGVPVVYDSVGKDTYEGSINCLSPRGMLVLWGNASGAVPPIDPLTLMGKGSLYMTRPTLGHYIATPEEYAWRAGDLFEWMAEGKLRVRIDKQFALQDAADAHRYLASRAAMGKILLIP